MLHKKRMRVRLQGPLASYELRHWSEREPGDELEPFVDSYAATSLLRRMLGEGQGFGLRALVERSGSMRGGFGRRSFGLESLDSDELLAQVADALVGGRIIAVRELHPIMASHEPVIMDAPVEPLAPQEIEDLGSLWLQPSAGAESLSLSVSAEPEVLEFETSHQGP